MSRFFGSSDVQSQLDAGLVWDGQPVDGGNLYRELPGTYHVPFPTWWRRFVFRVLTPRDIAVYLYVCTYMGPLQVSYPTIRTISDDLGSTNRHGVTVSLQRLVDRGFLLRAKLTVSDDNRHPRYVYQRPSAQYTIVTLLKLGYINGFLQPTAKTKRRTQEQLPGRIDSRLGKPLAAPLIQMVGRDLAEYGAMHSEPEKRAYVISKLQASIDAMRTTDGRTDLS